MSTKTIQELVKTTKGKIFAVEFVKRTTGEMRTMTCRTGASKGVTGEGRKYDTEAKNLISVYDMRKGFRNIPVEGVISFTFQKRRTEFK